MQVLVDVSGLPEVKRALIRVNRRQVAAAVRAAAEQWVKPVVADMKALCPVDTGALRESLGARLVTRKAGRIIMVVIGVRRRFVRFGRRPSRYAHLIEYGIPAYGRAARPFIRPVWDRHKLTLAARLAFLIRAELRARGLA